MRLIEGIRSISFSHLFGRSHEDAQRHWRAAKRSPHLNPVTIANTAVGRGGARVIMSSSTSATFGCPISPPPLLTTFTRHAAAPTRHAVR
eukprot:6187347-Pleurochrysis_carterae.AAC.1